MNTFFSRNIERRGRILRGIAAIVLLAGGAIALFSVWWLGLILIVSGAVGVFEALRGWCFLRACGIRTRL